MELIIDANELFSAVIALSRGRETKKTEIIFSDKVQLISPALLFYELEKYRELIKAKTGFADTDLDVLIEILKLRIKAIPLHEFSEFISKAESICKDAKDLPYFALALKQKCPLWSGDKALKEQSTIMVFNTKELVERFGL